MTTEYKVSIGEILVAIDKKTDSKLDLLPEGTSGNIVVSTETGIERSDVVLDGTMGITDHIRDISEASDLRIPTERAVRIAADGAMAGLEEGLSDVVIISTETGIKRSDWILDGVVKIDGKYLLAVKPKPLPAWHPRWAEIAVGNNVMDADYTPFMYTDENGTALTPNFNSAWNSVACMGTRQNGAVYYGNQLFATGETTSAILYRKQIADGVVGDAEKVWERTGTDLGLRSISINEETGAIAVLTAGFTTWASAANARMYIAPSIETLDASTPSIAQSAVGGSLIPYPPLWINNHILIGRTFFDSNGVAVRSLPSEIPAQVGSGTTFTMYGNSVDGYFIVRQPTSATGLLCEVYAYDWAANTASLMFSANAAALTEPFAAPEAWSQASFIFDSEREALLLLPSRINASQNGVQPTQAYFTTDGVTATPLVGAIDPNTISAVNYFPAHFQHINVAVSHKALQNRLCGWDGNVNQMFVNLNNLPSTAGLAGAMGFYAGKAMCVNGTRLYDVVRKL
jgi:hypothetical protein